MNLDIKAIIFWLKNRKPDIWKEKVAEAMADDEGTGVIVLTANPGGADQQGSKKG